MDFIDAIFDGSLMPHGHCLLWRPDLLFLHVGGDVLTALCYFAIPPALMVLRRRRPDFEMDGVVALFAAFIFLCGLSHMAGLVNIWNGFYWLEGFVKLSTGIVSALTLYTVWKLLPKVMEMPTTTALISNAGVVAQARHDYESLKLQIALAEQELADRKSELEEAMGSVYTPRDAGR